MREFIGDYDLFVCYTAVAKHCLSMPFVMNLACVLMRMTLKESLVAATLNAAGT